MTKSRSEFDIAVVGGGLAGASLACALGDTGLSVALIEAVSFDADPDPAMRARTIAIAWGTRVLFEELDLWSAMADHATAIERLHVSQRGHFGIVRVAAHEYDLPALGYVLPNTAMIEIVRERLARLDHVDVIAPARFESLSYEDDRVVLSLSGEGAPKQVSTRLLVGADGAESSVRAALSIATDTTDYEQSAVVTTLTTEYPHDACAYERFTPEGPVAILPRTKDTSALVWTLPTEQAAATCEMDEVQFVEQLQSAFGYRLGRLQMAGPRGAFPLKRVLADNAAAERAILIGNAGHFLHPAAAQGFNLTIRDALLLAAMLREQGAAGDFDPGDADLLAAWAEARRPDQHRVANFTDRIVRLFSNRVPGLASARSVGLVGLSLLPTIRHDMARRSMGLAVNSIRGVGQ